MMEILTKRICFYDYNMQKLFFKCAALSLSQLNFVILVPVPDWTKNKDSAMLTKLNLRPLKYFFNST